MAERGDVLKNCTVCGKEFRSYASANRRYCSRPCAIKEMRANTIRHGMSGTRLYRIYHHMVARCEKPAETGYAYYGARGISVCKEWRDSFLAFCEWANSSGYTPELELDRIDANGNYEPSNCRWATRKQQMANTRKRRDGLTSRFKGVSGKPGRWLVAIAREGGKQYLSTHKNELEAALAYDDAAYELRGEYARLNFPERKYKLARS